MDVTTVLSTAEQEGQGSCLRRPPRRLHTRELIWGKWPMEREVQPMSGEPWSEGPTRAHRGAHRRESKFLKHHRPGVYRLILRPSTF